MYHIVNDKRAIRSAQLIKDAMIECLNHKELNKIRVLDINKQSGVSRATFYRLFDNTQDVLVYICDQIFEESGEEALKNTFNSFQEIYIFFISKWMQYENLLDVLVKNNLTGIIYDAHVRNVDRIKSSLLSSFQLNSAQMDCLLYTLTALISVIINVWYLHNKKETAEELYYNMKNVINILDGVY